MYYHINKKSGLKAPLVADDVYEIIMKVPCGHRIFILGRCNLIQFCAVSL